MSFALWSVLQPRITRYKEDSSPASPTGPAASKRNAAEGGGTPRRRHGADGEHRDFKVAATGTSLLMTR